MDIVKKNLVSIILGVIAIAAVVATFYPMSGYFETLKGDVAKRTAQFAKAKQILAKPHELPVGELNAPADQRTALTVFPMPVITKDAQAYMKQLVDESKGVYSAAVDANRAENSLDGVGKDAKAMLLVNDALPDTRGSDADIRFRDALVPEAERLRTVVLNGGNPPTPEEQQAAADALQKVYNAKKIVGADGQALNEQEVNDAFEAERAKLPERLKNAVASTKKMYVDLTALTPPTELVSSSKPPSPDQIFYAQAAMWAKEDICRAIAEVNKGSMTVTDSPVKRLVSLTVPFGGAMYLRPPAGTGGEGAAPAPTPMRGGRFEGGTASMAEGAGQPNNQDPKADYTVSPTGRTCNKLYDVVNVNAVLHVDATKVPLLLKTLTRNRFITVRKVDFSRVDNNDLLQQGFVYGSAPVMELALDLELLQMREWTVPFMPQLIKQYVGATDWKSLLLDDSLTGAPAAETAAQPATPAAAPADVPAVRRPDAAPPPADSSSGRRRR